ncbi:TetR/AcrR family transcriptional regulator [Cohnella zeiphila]|uniref:TetR/AcrR family transcriptional regulator n=1 Tax=Cohnella zeiphila TaxID=2761120 RepID=A0A7X0SH12_9BACL|nr:TetR/AcrR family transcriptional regulator [Cohnella zeiphila]MBB6729822.1 TetR/AcrR family transcriptional regulator [Cohnella zeiphila]
MTKHSLRDIKREATANALAEAAFELARERGLDGFVVEDVVQRAGYSRRTFANHFSCKEEAVAAAAVTFKAIDEAEELIANLPESASPLDILHQLMKMQLTAELLRRMRELVAFSKRHPTLEPYVLSLFRGLQSDAQEIMRELSRGRYPEEYIHLLVGALYGAVLPLLDGSLNVILPGQPSAEHPGATTFEHYLDTIFGYLRNGF